jgi:hypothetical protein
MARTRGGVWDNGVRGNDVDANDAQHNGDDGNDAHLAVDIVEGYKRWVGSV